MLLSSAATHSIEEVAATDAPRWFQLYWVNDREICASFVRRAEEAGYGAIVVTLDTLTLGWRPRDLRQAYLPFIKGEGCGQYFSDPVFLSRLDKTPEEDPLTAAATMLATFPNLGLTWDDLDWLREQTTLPILVKGVLTADDAQLALAARRRRRRSSRTTAAARSTARSPRSTRSSRCATRCRDAVVLMDGGIRCAADVLKAMALGADAVLLGRPYAYALAVGGQRGVEELIQNLMAEIDLNLALAGRDVDARSRPLVADARRSSRARRARSRSRRSGSTQPGPGEVLVRIEATGVCHSDLHVIEEDGWGHPLPGAARPRGRRHGRGGRRRRRRPRAPATASCSAGRPPAARARPACAARRASASGRRLRAGRLLRATASVLTPVLRTGTFATHTVVPDGRRSEGAARAAGRAGVPDRLRGRDRRACRCWRRRRSGRARASR